MRKESSARIMILLFTDVVSHRAGVYGAPDKGRRNSFWRRDSSNRIAPLLPSSRIGGNGLSDFRFGSNAARRRWFLRHLGAPRLGFNPGGRIKSQRFQAL